jgi:hypothetical protein
MRTSTPEAGMRDTGPRLLMAPTRQVMYCVLSTIAKLINDKELICHSNSCAKHL